MCAGVLSVAHHFDRSFCNINSGNEFRISQAMLVNAHVNLMYCQVPMAGSCYIHGFVVLALPGPSNISVFY